MYGFLKIGFGRGRQAASASTRAPTPRTHRQKDPAAGVSPKRSHGARYPCPLPASAVVCLTLPEPVHLSSPVVPPIRAGSRQAGTLARFQTTHNILLRRSDSADDDGGHHHHSCRNSQRPGAQAAEDRETACPARPRPSRCAGHRDRCSLATLAPCRRASSPAASSKSFVSEIRLP